MTRGTAAPQERLEAIETLLLWEGRVSRSRLLDIFDIHSTLASRDIARFRELHPDACDVDQSSKSFVASPIIQPRLTKGTFLEYQRLIGAAGVMEAVEAGVPIESAHLDVTSIDHHVFAQIHRAVRLGRSVKIRYRSLTNPLAHDRTIRPHSLIQSGPRWHIRAYCAKTQSFRDFNLGRISKATTLVEGNLPGLHDDADWQTLVVVRLVPHRDLSSEQNRLVREEYMRGATAVAIEVRAPMVKYVIQSYRAAIEPDREQAPEHLLMVLDPDELPKGSKWIDAPNSTAHDDPINAKIFGST